MNIKNIFQRICERLTNHRFRKGQAYSVGIEPTEYHYRCRICQLWFWNFTPYRGSPPQNEGYDSKMLNKEMKENVFLNKTSIWLGGDNIGGKIKKKIEFFFKKLCITAQEYDAMIKDARVGSILGRSIAFNQENKTVDVSNDGFSTMKFTVSCTNVVTIDTEQLRKSLFKDDADVRFIVKGNKGKISFEG